MIGRKVSNENLLLVILIVGAVLFLSRGGDSVTGAIISDGNMFKDASSFDVFVEEGVYDSLSMLPTCCSLGSTTEITDPRTNCRYKLSECKNREITCDTRSVTYALNPSRGPTAPLWTTRIDVQEGYTWQKFDAPVKIACPKPEVPLL